ncbi:hypothetical protein FGG08_001201 [Glutinoglossum americanum]|uniref:Cupredoxin n=1 Tax=Glutinoglossum americanum TaxID=1670608 RepID=A0A9P8I2H8_9PEZI|nr:hypothetical protein FGG08_001201 [Glutinoglossum americanum]
MLSPTILATTLLALLLPFTNAQYGAPDTPSSSTSPFPTSASSGSSSTHTIEVGNGGLTFSPDTLNVPVGDTIEFRFYPMNHSVVQSTFDSPCVPSGDSALFSGFFPVQSGMAGTSWTIKVTDTKAIWLYCSQGSHCQMGMAAVINPPSSGKTLSAYKQAAVNIGASANPASPQGGVIGPVKTQSSDASTRNEAMGKYVLVMAMVVAMFTL